MNTDLELTAKQQHTLIQGLYSLAAADGVHEAEEAVIKTFYDDFFSDPSLMGPSFDELKNTKITTAKVAEHFNTPELQMFFMQTCFSLAFADGYLSADEKTHLRELATAFEMDESTFVKTHEQVKDALLGQFAHLHNMDALAEVAANLAL